MCAFVQQCLIMRSFSQTVRDGMTVGQKRQSTVISSRRTCFRSEWRRSDAGAGNGPLSVTVQLQSGVCQWSSAADWWMLSLQVCPTRPRSVIQRCTRVGSGRVGWDWIASSRDLCRRESRVWSEILEFYFLFPGKLFSFRCSSQN